MSKDMKGTSDLPVKREEFDIFQKFDELDDAVILAELEQRVTDVWIYHFKIEGKEIFGIGKAGVDECASRLMKDGIMLRDGTLEFHRDPIKGESFVCFIATVERVLTDKAGNQVIADRAIGVKRQSIFKKKGGEMILNPHYFEQGAMKAFRNARLRLIPEEIKTKVIEFAKKSKKRTKEIGIEKKEQTKALVETKKKGTEFPPANTPEFPSSQEQEDDNNATQDQIFSINRLQATLVDKYKFAPQDLIEETEKRFEVSDPNKMTKEKADEVIEFFENTIKHNIQRIKSAKT